MRLYSFYASQVDFLKNDCVKLLVCNVDNRVYKEDLQLFIVHLSYLLEILTERDIDSYFAKR